MPGDGFWSGVSKALFSRVRFGGVVGKVCLMFSVVALATALALRAIGDNTYGALAAAVIVLSGLIVVALVLWFADRHPDLALLEGAEWLQYQNMIQSKGAAPVLPDSPQPDALVVSHEVEAQLLPGDPEVENE